MRDKQITNKTKLVRNNELLTSNLDGEVVLLSIDNAEYYGLGETGTFIWQQLESPLTFEQLTENLLAHFEVEREQCMEDTLPFLQELVKKKVIFIADE
jgi:hypothetical protein